MNASVVIVHVPYQYRGGEDVHVEALAKAYGEIGIEPILYPPDRHPPGQLLKSALRSLLPSQQVPEDLERLCREKRPKLLHVHNAFPTLGPNFFRWALKNRTRLWMTVHNHRFFCSNGLALREGKICKACFESKAAWRPLLFNCNGEFSKSAYHAVALTEMHKDQLYQRAVSRFIAPSPYIRDELIRWGVEPRKVTHVLNPVAWPALEDKTRSFNYDVFYAGRLSEEKGVATLLEASRLLPELKFAIAGSGPLNPAVEHAAANCDNLDFLGVLSHGQVSEKLAASRIGILPSVCNEILPSSVLETFSMGKRCVISSLDSTKWLAEPSFPGHLAEPGNAADLARAIREALNAPAISAEKKAQIRQVLSFKRFCGDLKNLISEES